METTLTEPKLSNCPVPVVCPKCSGELRQEGETIRCGDCDSAFVFQNGFPDLIVGGRFDDPTDADCMCYEEQSNADLTQNYWLPLFERLWPDRRETVSLLSLGCGTGVDADMLADAGFNAVGIDNGNRTNVWPNRRHPERFLLANGKHLPFPPKTFDGVFCGCVFPHVGVVGDSTEVSVGYYQDRLALAKEMSRVVKPGGRIVVSSPNRLFPFDIFHGRKPGSYKPQFHWPTDPFLLSVDDYRKMFQEAGCDRAEAQPVAGYWGFIRAGHSWKGHLLSLPVRFLFWLASHPAIRFARSWPLNPWIVVLIEKNARA